MIKKCDLRECFEFCISQQTFLVRFFLVRNFWFSYRYCQGWFFLSVVLVAHDVRLSAWSTVLRSYPMSYKVAYRLVCSL